MLIKLKQWLLFVECHIEGRGLLHALPYVIFPRTLLFSWHYISQRMLISTYIVPFIALDGGKTAVSKTDAVCPLRIYVSIEETDRKQANDTVSDPMYDTCCEESKTE